MSFWKGSTDQDETLTSQLLKLSQLYSQQVDKNNAQLQNERVFLADQLKNSTTVDSLNNLKSTVEDYNNKVSAQGYDEYAINIDSKSYIYNQANNAYEEAKSIVDKNLGDPDVLYNEIMGYSWKETADELQKLYNLKGAMEEGNNANFNYKANGKYTSAGLIAGVNQRMGQLQNKIKIFEENEGSFLVYDSNGVMDEESRAIYEDLQFRVLSGNTEEFDSKYDAMITSTSRKYQDKEGDYLKWQMIQDMTANKLKKVKDINIAELAAGTNTSTEEMMDWLNGEMAKANLTDEDYLDPAMVQTMINDSKVAAEKYNKQHQVLTGDYFTDKYPWAATGIDESIPGLDSNDPASQTGKGTTFEEDLDQARFEKGAVSEETPEGVAETEAMMEQKRFETGIDVTEEEQPREFETIDLLNENQVNNEIKNTGNEGGNAKTWIAPAAIGTYALLDKKIDAGFNYMRKSTVKAVKYINSASKLSADQIERFLSSTEVQRTLEHLDKVNEKIANPGDYNIKKGSKEYKALLRRRDNIIKNRSSIWAKRFGVKKQNIERLYRSTDKWNIFKLKSDMVKKFPKVATKLFGKVGKIGAVAGMYQIGSSVAEAFGAETPGKVGAGAATVVAGKKLIPKIGKMLASKAGKKALIKFAAGAGAKRVASGIASGALGGPVAVLTGLGGLVWAGVDIINFIKDWKEE